MKKARVRYPGARDTQQDSPHRHVLATVSLRLSSIAVTKQRVKGGGGVGTTRWIKSLLCKVDNLSSDLPTHEKLEEVAQACANPVHAYWEMGGNDGRVTLQNPGRQLDRHMPQ